MWLQSINPPSHFRTSRHFLVLLSTIPNFLSFAFLPSSNPLRLRNSAVQFLRRASRREIAFTTLHSPCQNEACWDERELRQFRHCLRHCYSVSQRLAASSSKGLGLLSKDYLFWKVTHNKLNNWTSGCILVAIMLQLQMVFTVLTNDMKVVYFSSLCVSCHGFAVLGRTCMLSLLANSHVDSDSANHSAIAILSRSANPGPPALQTTSSQASHYELYGFPMVADMAAGWTAR